MRQARGPIWLTSRNSARARETAPEQEWLLRRLPPKDATQKYILVEPVARVEVTHRWLPEATVVTNKANGEDGSFEVYAWAVEDRKLDNGQSYPDRPDSPGHIQYDSDHKAIMGKYPSTTAHHLVGVKVEVPPEKYELDGAGNVVATCGLGLGFTKSLGQAREFNANEIARLQNLDEASRDSIVEARMAYLRETYPQRYLISISGVHRREEPLVADGLRFTINDRWQLKGSSRRGGFGSLEREKMGVQAVSGPQFNLVRNADGRYQFDDSEILNRFEEIANTEAVEDFFVARRQAFETNYPLSVDKPTEVVYRSGEQDPTGLGHLDYWEGIGDMDHPEDGGDLDNRYLVKQGEHWFLVIGIWERNGGSDEDSEKFTFRKIFNPIPEPPTLASVLTDKQLAVWKERQAVLRNREIDAERHAQELEGRQIELNRQALVREQERQKEAKSRWEADGGDAPKTVRILPPGDFYQGDTEIRVAVVGPDGKYSERLHHSDPAEANKRADWWLETHRVREDGKLEERVAVPMRNGGGHEWREKLWRNEAAEMRPSNT